MKLSKEDRSTALTLAIVLVICTVCLVFLLNWFWQIVSPTVVQVTSYLGRLIQVNTVNYNFTVPEVVASSSSASSNPSSSSSSSSVSSSVSSESSSSVSSSQVSILPAAYTYIFPVPATPAPTPVDPNLVGFKDAIVNDAKLAGGTSTPQVNLQLLIPKIKINSPVLQGLGGEALLDRGFWVHPSSRNLGEGEMILLCHRRFFGPSDPRSCWYLDKLTEGDELVLKKDQYTVRYEVIGRNVFKEGDPLIYAASSTEDYLKIVTCTPLGSNSHRLVVLAKRVEE